MSPEDKATSVPILKTWIVKRSGLGLVIVGNTIFNEPSKVWAKSIVASAGQDIMAFSDGDLLAAVLLLPNPSAPAVGEVPTPEWRQPGERLPAHPVICRRQRQPDSATAKHPIPGETRKCATCGAGPCRTIASEDELPKGTLGPLPEPKSEPIGPRLLKPSDPITIPQARARLRKVLAYWKRGNGSEGLDAVVDEIALLAVVCAGGKVVL